MSGRNKILITGGLGYVGGRLINYLENTTSYKIVISTRKEQLPNALNGKRFEYYNLSESSNSSTLNLLNEIDLSE